MHYEIIHVSEYKSHIKVTWTTTIRQSTSQVHWQLYIYGICSIYADITYKQSWVIYNKWILSVIFAIMYFIGVQSSIILKEILKYIRPQDLINFWQYGCKRTMNQLFAQCVYFISFLYISVVNMLYIILVTITVSSIVLVITGNVTCKHLLDKIIYASQIY